MKTHDWQYKKCQSSMQQHCAFCLGVILAPECLVTNKTKTVTAPEKKTG